MKDEGRGMKRKLKQIVEWGYLPAIKYNSEWREWDGYIRNLKKSEPALYFTNDSPESVLGDMWLWLRDNQ